MANGSLYFRNRRIGPAQEIPVTVFKGQADETPFEIILDETSMHFIKGNDIDAGARKTAQKPFEKLGRDFQVPVRLKRIGARWGARDAASE